MPQEDHVAEVIPKASEGYGSLPQTAENVGAPTFHRERKASHTLTVKQVARMLEEAGVARTERSIVNWCQPNRMGVAHLDCYFDPNERKYYITEESVRYAIQEEQSRAAQREPMTPPAQPETPKAAERPAQAGEPSGDAAGEIEKLRQENLDLQIMNRGKDYLITELRKERATFTETLVDISHRLGAAEEKLLRLSAPGQKGSETAGSAGGEQPGQDQTG